MYENDIIVPRTFHYDSYGPNAPPPGTPEPESHTAERYAAWGRNYFGEEWYNQRERMLRERRIYMDRDLVYEQRQKALRVLEHIIEGRLHLPGIAGGKTGAESWKRLWARISDVVPKLPPLTPRSNSSSDSGSNDGDGNGNDTDTDLSGYSTYYDPTSSPRSPTPVPDDPLEGLEFNRRRFSYIDEEFYYVKIFMLECFVDDRRKARDNEAGDKLLEKFDEETEKIRVKPGTAHSVTREYLLLMRLWHYWKKGLTPEQVEANIREGDEASEQFAMACGRPSTLKDPEPKYDKE